MTVAERMQALFERRPDLHPAALTPFTTMQRRSVELIAAGRRVPRPQSEAELNSVLDQIENGEILRLGGHTGAIEISEPVQRGAVRVQRSRDFYLTQTVKQVKQVLDYCVEHAAIGVITAEYGAGKTESVAHWRKTDGREIDHIVFEFDEFSSRGVVDFITLLADMLEVAHRTGPQSGSDTMRAVCAALNARPALLIFDQCESVFPRILQVIRQIHDHTRKAGVGVVLLASPMFMAKLHAGRMRDVGALTSRVSIWAALRGVQKDEAANIVRQEGLHDIEAAAFDLLWKATGGSMRRLMAITDLLMSKHAGKPVTERTVVGVAQNLFGLTLYAPKGAA